MFTTLFFVIALLFAVGNAQQIQGLWKWTWSGNFDAGNTNLAIAFSGWTDPATALGSSNINVPGEKYLSLGGGNGNGHWTAGALNSLVSYCNGRQLSGYSGVAFDIEEGDGGLGSAFIDAFSACKNNGYKVLVTVSHSTPYGIPDGAALMNTFFSNAGLIDYMSPQLYTSGAEGSNDFTVNGVSWESYAPFSGKLIPSIVSEGLYNDAANYFQGKGINVIGFVQWAQQRINGNAAPHQNNAPPQNNPHSNPNPPPPQNQNNGNGGSTRCGTDWGSAAATCGTACPSGTDNQCPGGQHCYASLDTSPCNNNPPPPTPNPPHNPPQNNNPHSTVRCGGSWTDANNGCGKSCSTNADCDGGSWCWAALSTGPCGGSQAVDGSSNTYAGSNASGSGLEPAAIGIIVGGCVIGVAMIIVAIVMIVSANKRVESA